MVIDAILWVALLKYVRDVALFNDDAAGAEEQTTTTN
jgi:hypothetical protein